MSSNQQKSSKRRFELSTKSSIKRSQKYQSLSFEQKYVFDRVVFDGDSIFFTGQAGSGKSYLLTTIVFYLKQVVHEGGIAITSMTGIASLNINGQTLHSLTGARILNQEEDQLYSNTPEQNEEIIFKNSHKNNNIWKRLQTLEVLFIDEVSMCPNYLFDALNILM